MGLCKSMLMAKLAFPGILDRWPSNWLPGVLPLLTGNFFSVHVYVQVVVDHPYIIVWLSSCTLHSLLFLARLAERKRTFKVVVEVRELLVIQGTNKATCPKRSFYFSQKILFERERLRGVIA